MIIISQKSTKLIVARCSCHELTKLMDVSCKSKIVPVFYVNLTKIYEIENNFFPINRDFETMNNQEISDLYIFQVVCFKFVKMKFFVVAFVALAAISIPAATPAITGEKIDLSVELKSPVSSLVQEVIEYEARQILTYVPATKQVNITELLAALAKIGSTSTVGKVLGVVLKQYGITSTKLVDILPKVVANTSITISDLASKLLSKYPRGTSVAPFGSVLTYFGVYLLELLVDALLKLLKSLS